MSYIESTLATGENVLHKAKMDWSVKWNAIMYSCFAVLFFIVWPILGLLFALLAIKWFIDLRTTEMCVTDRRIMAKKGWISRKTVELRLSRFESAEVKQGVLGRMLNCRAKVVFTGTGTQKVVFDHLSSDEALRVKGVIEDALHSPTAAEQATE